MKRIVWTLAVLFWLNLGVVNAGDPHHTPAASTDPRFEFLKQLEGTWVGTGLNGSEGVYEFRVTAGGTAVEEREMVGTPMEMLTVYTMQGGDLVATHYCMMGNQPRLIAKKMRKKTLDFECAGVPGNAKSHDDHHVHGWSMRIDDEGRLHYAAELVERGQTTESPTVVLSRQPRTASR